MVQFRDRNGFWPRPRLRRLHELQEEIYRQLQLLMPDQVAHFDSFTSKVEGSPVLRMDILERHRYTRFMRLTYRFSEADADRHAPEAHLRMYEDARMAEVTAFNPEQGCRRSAHPWYPNHALFRRTWRQNVAMDKWLGYLLSQGHSVVTMQPLELESEMSGAT